MTNKGATKTRKNILLVGIITIILGILSTEKAYAQDKNSNFFLGKIINIKNQYENETNGYKQNIQLLEIERLDTKEKIEYEYGAENAFTKEQLLSKDETIILTKVQTPQGEKIIIMDRYRIPAVNFLIFVFVALAILLTGKKGAFAVLGLWLSSLIILNFIVPNILAGKNALLISLSGAVFISITSIYLAHGFNRNTTLALISSLITLVISIVLAFIFVKSTKLTGAGSEEVFFLQIAQGNKINFTGLLLGGILMGVLGVLDDITTAQTTMVEELKKTNPRLTVMELYTKAINVGKEHITSLINTLFLAYAGASLPLFLLFRLNNSQPFWVTLNSEFIVEEIVRTVVGSIALILAVPIASFIAAVDKADVVIH